MKILYVTTISNTVNAFLIPHIKMLINEGHEVDVAFNIEQDIKPEIIEIGCKIYEVPFQRSPLNKNNIKAYKMVKQIIIEGNYDLVHTHTPVASAIVRLACSRLSNIKVFYTAHGFHFYKGAPRKNWMVYYPIEWFCAHWTDTLITINSEDYEFAKKKMKAKNVVYVPGVGIDLSKFGTSMVDVQKKREELAIPDDGMVLLSVGELNENKNHETVIRAITGMDLYYLIAGKGDKEKILLEIAKEVGMEGRVKLLGYRRDVPELLQIADIFVFPSYREGLSVSLMETMASGKPATISKIRGNVDLIDKIGGEMFDPYSIDECRKAIEKVIKADIEKMGKYNKEKVQKFSLEVVLKKIDEIYRQ